MAMDAELVLDAQAELGEGAIWDARSNVLLWVNITADEVHVYDPVSGDDRCLDLGQPVGTIVPRVAGGAAVALKHGFHVLDLESGDTSPIAEPEDSADHRFNDGKCDPAGRFWAGACHMNCSDPVGTLYCLFADGRVEPRLTELRCPNGIVWTADRRTMYYIDTGAAAIWAFDYDDASGGISNQRTVVEVPAEMGFPDGMTIDAEGRLWVAHWGGCAVHCWDPGSGEVVATVNVPAKQVTSCAFGGPALDTLYITSARKGLADDELERHPASGGLFGCRPGAVGVPAVGFAG
jgi:sugar lactone lactonase YvrE